MSLGHQIKSRLPAALRAVLRTGQRFGMNITPAHFYSDVPNLRELEQTTHWRHPRSMHGIHARSLDEQLGWVAQACEPVTSKLATTAIFDQAVETNGEPGYGPIEAMLLYAMLRYHKPGRIRQIGCGVTTAIALQATADEPGYDPMIQCIEPYPTAFLKQAAAEKRLQLESRPAQDMDTALLADLSPGDLLFVDSTHTVRVGSEVPQIMLEVIPHLPAGVWVHFHDIMLPYDFGPDTLGQELFFWRETAMLYALLVGNASLQLVCAMSMLHHERAAELKRWLPPYEAMPMDGGLSRGAGHFPSAAYLLTREG